MADNDILNKLKQQILAQGTSSKWSGEGFGSAEANAADMAKILAHTGITDISQFGKVQTPVYETYQIQTNPFTGNPGYIVGEGEEAGWVDAKPDVLKAVDKNGVAKIQTGTQETIGNKLTGQAVPNTYSERQTGNFFGGTFEGKGNTGYGVQFDAQGMLIKATRYPSP